MDTNGKGGDEKEPLHSPSAEKSNSRNRSRGLYLLMVMDPIYAPILWLKKLVGELNWSFVLTVVIVYGINQGFGMGLTRVSVPYYMKDVQKLQPSQAQIYSGIIQIPWIIKPLWGLLTDTLPIFGYRRKSYFHLSGLLGIVSMLVLSLRQKESLAFALTTLMTASAGAAIADVTVDACVTQNSIAHPSLAGDMQSLNGFSSSIGALVGFSLSGIFVHLVGSKGVFGMLCIPASLVIVAGMVLKESRVPRVAHHRLREKFVDAATVMWTTVKCREVWRPCLYMYLSLALSLNIREGMFFWYTDAEDGPKFSQGIVGSILSFGAIGSLVGVFLYQNYLKGFGFRETLLWAQLLYSVAGLLDVVLVLRINLKLGIPDYIFVVMDDLVSMLIVRLKWMPLLVLSSKLCPSGIEGTFFALLMSIDHLGLLSSSWTGGLLLYVLKVTRTQFDNLWMAVLIRSFMRLLPVGLLFLIPRSDATMQILPNQILMLRMPTTKKTSEKEEEEEEEEEEEMASLVRVDHT